MYSHVNGSIHDCDMIIYPSTRNIVSEKTERKREREKERERERAVHEVYFNKCTFTTPLIIHTTGSAVFLVLEKRLETLSLRQP